MKSGGYRGPEESLGLLGCAVLVVPYLFIVGWIIEEFGYGGRRFSEMLLVWVAVTTAFFVIAQWLASVSNRPAT